MVGAKKPELIGREEKELRKCKVQQEYGAVLSRIKRVFSTVHRMLSVPSACRPSAYAPALRRLWGELRFTVFWGSECRHILVSILVAPVVSGCLPHYVSPFSF